MLTLLKNIWLLVICHPTIFNSSVLCCTSSLCHKAWKHNNKTSCGFWWVGRYFIKSFFEWNTHGWPDDTARSHNNIVLVCRQFLVDERDRKFQLVLWRANKEDKLKVFQLNTVTYGLAAAPFLAIRSLFFIADKYKLSYPTGSQVLREDLYVANNNHHQRWP